VKLNKVRKSMEEERRKFSKQPRDEQFLLSIVLQELSTSASESEERTNQAL
jgi:hypothetical protein